MENERPIVDTSDAPGATSDPAAPSPLPGTAAASPAEPGDAIPAARLAQPSFALPLLILFCAALFFVNLGGYPLYTKGEPREAVTVVDMFKGGSLSSFLLPMRAGVEIPSKPLMMHWLIALASCLIGALNAWAVRLPSALLATFSVLCCYLYVRRLFEPLAGLFAALAMAATLQFLQSGTGARVDMTLTFFMEVGFFEFIMIAEGLTRRRMLLYAALACAVLSKGPVGLLLPGAAGLAFIVMERRWSLLRDLRMGAGALMVAIIAGGWYLAAVLIGGHAFVDKQILAENIFTFFYQRGVSGGHGHPFYYLELALLVGFLPWSVMLPFVGTWLVGERSYRNPRVRYLLVWFAVVLVFYNFAYSKRGVYLLSLYPALAAATGLMLSRAYGALKPPRWVGALTSLWALFVLAAGVAGTLGAFLLLLWPAAMETMFGWCGIVLPAFTAALATNVGGDLLAAAALLVALFALAYQLRRYSASVGRLVAGVCAGTAALTMAANIFVLPAIAGTLTLKGFARQAAGTIGEHSAAYLDDLNYDIAFYLERTDSGLKPPHKTIPVLQGVGAAPPDFLIAPAKVYAAQGAGALRDYALVMRSRPSDFDGHGAFVLLRRNPAAAH